MKCYSKRPFGAPQPTTPPVAMETFSEGQLNKFSKLIRVAARYIFSGDLHERLQELEAQKADNYGLDASQQPKKPRRKRVRAMASTFVQIAKPRLAHGRTHTTRGYR